MNQLETKWRQKLSEHAQIRQPRHIASLNQTHTPTTRRDLRLCSKWVSRSPFLIQNQKKWQKFRLKRGSAEDAVKTKWAYWMTKHLTWCHCPTLLKFGELTEYLIRPWLCRQRRNRITIASARLTSDLWQFEGWKCSNWSCGQQRLLQFHPWTENSKVVTM